MKDIFDEIKNKAEPVLERYPVLFAYLYGSAISGSRTPLSDIDIGLAVSKDVIADEYLDLELSIEAELGRALALSKLDIRIINAAPVRFKAQYWHFVCYSHWSALIRFPMSCKAIMHFIFLNDETLNPA